MAENVQYNIESSLQELEQLKRVGLFSDSEIRKVIRKRKILEYNLAKTFKRKEDYLKYIQYEIALLNLIRIRRHKLRYFHKRSEIDNAIGNRINRLFKGAVKKFPEDIKLWFSHHDFLKKMHWVESMSSMNSNMLHIHNKSPELWVVCAKWEVEDNSSMVNARKLLQRALRFHPQSELIWKEYFRLELLYVDQLLKRRAILGLERAYEDASEDNILKGEVAAVVYNNAIQKIDSVDFALSFLPICKEFDFTTEIIQTIYSDIESRHPKKEELLNAIAQRCMDHNTQDHANSKTVRTNFENAILKFEDAVISTHTEKMWDFYIQFLLERICESKSEKKMKRLLVRVFEVLQRAHEMQLLSKKMHIEWIRLLYTQQEMEKAQKVALEAANMYPMDATVWQHCLMLHAQIASDEDFLKVFYKAIANVNGKPSLPLWETVIDWATCGKIKHIQEIFEKGLLQGRDVQIYIKNVYLKVTSTMLGINETRALYDRLKKSPPLSLEFFETMVASEKSQHDPSFKRIKRCYEDAIGYFGDTSPDVWLGYMKVMESHLAEGTDGIGKIYWRAMKHLKPEKSDEFVKKHTSRFNTTYSSQ